MKHYFVCANSGNGFVNYFNDLLVGLDKVFILKGGPGTGKSTLMKKIASDFETKDFDVDYIHCSSDPDSLDGVIIKNINVAIVDGTAPHVIEPSIAGAIGEYINIGSAWKVKLLENSRDEIEVLQKKIAESYDQAYVYLKNAKKYHDELEKYYIEATDYGIVDQIYEQVKERISEYKPK